MKLNNHRHLPYTRLSPSVCFCIFLLTTVFPFSRETHAAVEFKNGEWRITAMIVKDLLLPMPPHEDIEKALRIAEDMIQTGYHAKVKFVLLDEEKQLDTYYKEIYDEFLRTAKPDMLEYEKNQKHLDWLNVKESDFNANEMKGNMTAGRFYMNDDAPPGGRWFFDDTASRMDNFVRCFPPDQRAAMTTPDAVVSKMINYIIKDAAKIKMTKTVDGALYFEKGVHPYNYDIFRLKSRTNDVQLFITNTPVFGFSEYGTWPHIIQWGLIHGMSLGGGLMDDDLYDGRIFISTFIVPFERVGDDAVCSAKVDGGADRQFAAGWASPDAMNVIADFITHETGHFLFNTPDTTDPLMKGCASQRDYETVDDSCRLKLAQSKRPCDVELLLARFGAARAYAQAGEKDKAFSIYQEIMDSNKDNIDVLDFAAYQMMKAGLKKKAWSLIRRLQGLTTDSHRLTTYNSWMMKLL